MAKKIVFTLLSFALLLVVFANGAMAEEFYSPFAPVIVTDVTKELDQLSKEELPQILKMWEVMPRATFAKQFIQQLDIFGWATTKYRGESSFLNNAISCVVKIPSKNYEFTLVFSEYRWQNSKVGYYCGGEVTEVAPEEFEKIKYVYAQKICESANYLVGFVGNKRGEIIDLLKERLVEYGVISKSDDLEQKLTELGTFDFNSEFKISADELMFIPPKFTFRDFCPVKAVIVPMPVDKGGMILGLSYPDSGTVAYSPVALVLDYLKFEDVFTHELLHRSAYQGILVGQETDVETWASFVERNNGSFTYLFHSYQETARNIGKVITSFDAERARREMIKFRLGPSLDLEESVFEDYSAKAEKIFSSFRKTMFEKFMPKFYMDPLYWACVNDALYDQNGSFKTFFYTRYAFTLLNGPQKTQKWLADHEEIIRLAYEEAKKIVDKHKAEQKAKEKNSEIIPEMIKKYFLENRQLVQVYSNMLGLPESMPNSVKIEKIYLLIKTGVITMPQMMYRETGRIGDELL
ncbi:hypothetical protein KKA27_01880 [Patescibacteria group bacterium]|nr:hypothetical protein [Patescibacteria group bacterium]MBU2633199.1 hypothetical protein [Patescibacteria group bacterium]